MDLFQEFEKRFERAVEDLRNEGVLPADLALKGQSIEPPRDAAHGDLAANTAMVLAKPAGLNPRELAEKICEKLDQTDVEDLQIAGPGFITVTLDASYWPNVVRTILQERGKYGRSSQGEGRRVNVEHVSANPTGPLHVGHGRGAVFGDALANLLEHAGFEVAREYYINDAGAQIDNLARSAFWRYREALGEKIPPIPQGLYPGDYLKPVGAALATDHGRALLDMDEAQWLPIVREAASSAMMDQIRDDLAALDNRHQVFFSERSLIGNGEDQVAATIAELDQKGLIYEGRLPPPKGKKPDDWEDREQTLFRATQFGDDIDRPLIKPDGSYTYFASDMAYHRDKIARGFLDMIDVWGADHGGYVKRMRAAVKALSDGAAELDVKICQLVRLFRGGEPIKMSKRAGDFVTLREVVDEVGAGPVRFMMLYRKNDAVLDFDLEKVLEQSRDNPVFYVQYAHARAHSVFRNTKQIFKDFDEKGKVLENSHLYLLDNREEISLMKKLSQYPRVVEAAASVHEPHRIAFYLYELASDFHGLWTRGKESPQLRFINDTDRDLTMARVALVAATAEVVTSGLGILGVQPIREMR
ncbi:MAG: arginine--tRNA ligase [Methyloligellaceae bacterium]